MGTYIWLEGRVQHACFQPPEVEVFEERVLLHFLGPSSSAPQALQRVFAQELQRKGNQSPGVKDALCRSRSGFLQRVLG